MKKIINLYKENRFVVNLFLISFLLRLLVVVFINAPIISDFKTMYDASLELLNHIDNYKSSPYFLLWAYQMGHVIYQSILLKIVNNVLLLKIINSLVTSFSIVLVFLICKRVVKERYAKIISIIYMIFPFPLLLNNVLTNQFVPITLTLFAIYLLIKINYDKYVGKSIIIGILIGVGNILRSEGIVFIFSIFLYTIFLTLKKYDLKKVCCSFFLILISYLFIFNSVSILLEKTNISPNGLNNMNSNWKFVLGFNYETNGMYSNSDASSYASDKEKSKEVVVERLKDFKKIPSLFIKKTKILWFNSDLSWSLGHLENKKIYDMINALNQLFIISILLLDVIGFYSIIKNNIFKLSRTAIICTIILMTYFFVYLLIEVMPRYAYSLQAFEMVLAGIGLEFMNNKFHFRKKLLSKISL